MTIGEEYWAPSVNPLERQRTLPVSAFRAAKVPGWGYTESVLVDEGRVICTPGGKNGTFAALNAETGKVIWRSRGITDRAQ